MAHHDRFLPPHADVPPRRVEEGPVLPEKLAGTHAGQAAHAADFVIRRTTDEGVSPNTPVLRLEVPEPPIKADQN